MVLIETIRNVIRPGTLAVRLAANIIAGHLLLTLLGRTGPSLSFVLVSFLLFAQILLLIFLDLIFHLFLNNDLKFSPEFKSF